MDALALLKDLCSTPGISGYEARVRDVIRATWQPLTTEIHVDRVGSLWATKAGRGKDPRPRIMLAAHMDAIGLMVSHVQGEFLRVVSVGGIDARVMPGQPVTVHGREDVPGLVAQPPGFLLPKANRDGVAPVDELLIDTGLSAERLADLVRAGDVVSAAQPPRQLQGDYVAATYLDNRASVVAVTECLDALQHRPHGWDVVAVATVQEETRLLGAFTSAFALRPQLAVAIDVTQGTGSASKEFSDKTYPLGGGPVLGLGPNIHSKLHSAIKAVAEKMEMPHTLEAMPTHSGTDAFAMQVAREGIPTMVVSIPLRNMHTPVEIVAVKDVVRVGRLLAEFIAGLTPEFMETLALD